jgi:hypothetical protein
VGRSCWYSCSLGGKRVIVDSPEVRIFPYESVSRLISESDLLSSDLKDSSFKASLVSVCDDDSVTRLEIVFVSLRSCWMYWLGLIRVSGGSVHAGSWSVKDDAHVLYALVFCLVLLALVVHARECLSVT